MVRKVLKYTLYTFMAITTILILVVVAIFIMAWQGAKMEPPSVATNAVRFDATQKVILNDSVSYIGKHWFVRKSNGLSELYTEGEPYTRGLANGILTEELIHQQEDAFVAQIKKMIPSEQYLKFLKYITGFMNRDLEAYVPLENQQEIYGISQASSAAYEWIGTPFFRQMNYHAAHDIGHALQSMMLVGCTSLSAWSSKAADGKMIVGRNFDFWVGDEFAKDKIVSFVRPSEGIPFAFVTWGAFTGVSSGMNMEGLTVTINAAKSSIPTGAATPVSLVARHILQYATNIAEAITIANGFKMFVSESFMIASAKDGYSIVIEKTPEEMHVYKVQDADYITCANHYQSDAFQQQKLNQEQLKESASLYRQQRVKELIDSMGAMDVNNMAYILRDKKGLKGTSIGMGNEKAINQLIAHHSIIFKPEEKLMWVSTNPWQEGEYVCYDLNEIFNTTAIPTKSVAKTAANIPASDFVTSTTLADFILFRTIKNNWTFGKAYVDPTTWMGYNPEYYDTYRIAGEMYLQQKDTTNAMLMLKKGLQLEIATVPERNKMQQLLHSLKK